MAQLNITTDQLADDAINALASELGSTRSKVGLMLIREALNARRDGKHALTPPAPTPDAATLRELAAQLAALNVEQDRALRDHARRTAKLESRWTAGEEAYQAAHRRLAEQLRERLAEGYRPFQAAVELLRTEIAAHVETILEAIREQPRLDSIDAKIGELNVRLQEARPVNNFKIDGLDFTKTGWGVVAFVAFAASTLLLLVMAKALPDNWLANPLAVTMFGSTDRAIASLGRAASGGDYCRRFGLAEPTHHHLITRGA